MNIDQVRQFEGLVVRIRTQDPVLGGGTTFEGRLELLDDSTFQVVGQPKLGGLSLGDATPYKDLIAHISEITPTR